ncbi:MAG: hypothetical protein AB1758_21050, partial [Candidatus Eremiobacterota bacterium]
MSIQPETTAPMSERQFTISQFAEAAGTSTRRVRRMIQQGRLRTWVTPTGETRIPEGELKRLEARRERQNAVTAVRPLDAPEVARVRLIPLRRHEAAMVRVGYLEAELASLKARHEEVSEREIQLRCRVDQAEEEAV